MTTIGGLDDAGRGPVIGPMVLAGVCIPEEAIPEIKAVGAKDSKGLTPKKREEIYAIITKKYKYHFIIITPQEIDEAVLSKTTNLNNLEAQKFAMIINKLQPDKVIIDCPSTNIKAYTAYVKRFLKQDTKLKCEHKADVNHAVVGAASIIAKVIRDREIKAIQEEIGEDIGSGYPADERTKEFIKNKWKTYPHIFRKSWATYQKLANNEKQKTLGSFECKQ